ncbi:MAG TPA: DUF2723 domain-containing protein [Candidatus Acidoferrales bacterium]|nr:DUF2723 domain-containing protein [Candidatus Acidoferrales bacterium]
MNFKYLNRCIALGLFLVTLTMYRMTSQSSVAFWDCGEYAATSPALEVPHPPGAPLFILLGRVAMMTPYVSDPALRINLISALASALTIMFLYLIGVKVISRWKSFPVDLHSSIIIFGSSAIGALTFSVTDTFWFNAAESSLFASSMFFVSCVIWLGMTWYDKAEEPGSQRYLLLAAYLMGLSIGIHQLSILAYFAIALLIYFKYYEFGWRTFFWFGVITVFSFFIIYPGIVKWLATILNGDVSFGPFDLHHNIVVQLIPPGIVIAAIYGIYKAEKAKRWIVSISLMAGLLIILGYSTYTLIYIRANAHPAINENNPSNLARMVIYLNREQYGEQRMFPRMWSSEPQYVQNYKNYSSDLDYFASYQLTHMYLRYLGFNFIGRAGDIQDGPVTLFTSPKGWFDGRAGYPTRYFAIPFLLALFGIWYHVKKDWKFSLVFLALFATLGLALVVFFNMQNPQPRERDYFFVGSFFVFAMWIGVGASGIIDLVTDAFKTKQEIWNKHKNILVGGTVAVLMCISPIEMFSQNLYCHNRHGNFAPFDYSYNILQSCKPNAILFTNGDNDTFPLWYLQEGMGIRTDIRIVNLSLVNTDWYILQLKNETPHGAVKVPISISDDQIRNISPVEWHTTTFKLPVPKDVYEQFGITDTSITDKGYIQYTVRPTLQAGDVQAIRVQDIVMNNIVQTNQWKRPVYYAVTVAPDNFIGLTPYLQMQGLALQLMPKANNVQGGDYEINLPIMKDCLMEPEKKLSTEPQYGFLFRNLDDPHVFYDYNVRNLMVNYRYSYLRLAAYYEMHGDSGKAIATLDTMEARVPNEVLPMKYDLLSDIARMYYMAGATSQFQKFANIVESGAREAIEENPNDVQRYYNPYRILLDIYGMENQYQKSIALLQKLQGMFPNDNSISREIARLQTMMKINSAPLTPDTSLIPKTN